MAMGMTLPSSSGKFRNNLGFANRSTSAFCLRVNDWFAVGDYQGMKNYCSVFDNINDLFYRVISSHKSWCNEHALYEMLKVRNTSVNFADFELKWDKLNYKSKMLNYLKY
jgi:hypothetical protein